MRRMTKPERHRRYTTHVEVPPGGCARLSDDRTWRFCPDQDNHLEHMSHFPSPTGFSVRTEQRGATAVVIPTGELDIDTAPTLVDGLERAFESRAGRVVLDLRELEFIDSSGLRSLLMARRRAESSRKHFALVAGSRELERILEIAGVHSIFDWTPADEPS